MRTRIIVGSLVGAVAIHGVFIACSGMPSMKGSDGGMNHFLEAMKDAAADAIGLEVNDAQAQTGGSAMSAECDRVYTQTSDNSTGYHSEVTQWYAEIRAAGLDLRQAPHISAYICDYEAFNAPNQCPQGATCANTPGPFPVQDCSGGIPFLAAGKILVYCGSRIRTTSAGTTVQAGSRGRRVFFRVN